MLFYAVSFGGFVGLASYLTIYFSTEYGLSAITAGYFTALCVGLGSVFRPLGVRFAERAGSMRALAVLFTIAAIFIALASFGLPAAWMALGAFAVAMLALGMGNGAVFQLVPQRFRKDIGVMTAMIGMAGAVGGFLLVAALGASRYFTASYQTGLLLFAAAAALALAGLWIVKNRWRTGVSARSAVSARA
jgi:NNP family nitrate/nitrite transporter-like MFS transporter